MIVKLLTEHHLEFLSLKGGCRGSSESTHVKIPHCWESHALAHIILILTFNKSKNCANKSCNVVMMHGLASKIYDKNILQ